MGYRFKRQFITRGESYVFILNNFTDLQAMIPKDKAHVEYKVTLQKYHYYKVNKTSLTEIIGW